MAFNSMESINMRFSERYGYVKPSEVLKRGYLDEEVISGICSCFDSLEIWLNHFDRESREASVGESYSTLDLAVWCYFLNHRRNDYRLHNGKKVAVTSFMESPQNDWFLKMDLIEFSIQTLQDIADEDESFLEVVDSFVRALNNSFDRLNYAYRIVGNQVVEITEEEEIKEIETAQAQTSSIKIHVSNALKQLSNRPTPDYRNSIKESISAVEALCREITGESDLANALNRLENKGIIIPTFLKSAFVKLYIYTNDSRTGIRHALMDEKEVPGYDEAKFMLITCCAFINYIQGRRAAR
jgi:hypothetical protein